MNYDEWAAKVPEEITGDSLWKVEAYRLALFLAEVSWFDVTTLLQDKRTLDIADQLFRAIGSIGANIAEGYSRGTGRDRARFYEYALGSAREGRDWYYKSHYLLAGTVIAHRLKLTTQIIRLLLVMIPQQRGRTLRDNQADYHLNHDSPEPDILTDLLHNIPLP